MRIHAVSIAAAISACTASLTSSWAAIVYEDNFDSGLSGFNWVTNTSSFDAFVDYAYDYAIIGVPAAPNSNGTTIGMRFVVNQSAGVFQGISASPFNQSFTGDFTIRFDMWLNFVGPLSGGGSGTTQMASFGWGTNGLTVQWAGDKHSVMFAGSSDGGTAQDYRAYLRELAPAVGAPVLPSTGVYAAGTSDPPAADSRNNTDPYYAGFGGVTAPAEQQALYGSQSGTSPVGTLGMAWHDMLIEKSGDNVSWYVDNLRIATVPITGATLGGENIFFGMFDINNASSTDLNDFLNAAIYDNIRVDLIPEPSSVALCGLALAGFFTRRRRQRGA